jgi:maltooligosyltrehalose trehalohydrolase
MVPVLLEQRTVAVQTRTKNGKIGATTVTIHRRLPIGADVQPGGGVHFRVWAPVADHVEVVIEAGDHGPGGTYVLARDGQGFFGGLVGEAADGTRYRYRLGGGDAYPDPASRFQPDGPHGPSQVVDPSPYVWQDEAWSGITTSGLTVYELHVGTFTREGTWRAAEQELPWLVELGITAIEMMPVADFPGRFGWGYDGVHLFAPTRLYGEPDDLRHFVDTAHGLGLGVILDVVYNHFGPDGCWLDMFSPDYFTDRHTTEWGRALNFDGPHAHGIRELIVANAGYWIDEFHFDGLRLDATHAIVDQSGTHVIAEVGQAVRRAAGGRTTWVVAENEPQLAQLARSEGDGGAGLDALWNEDFHHVALVALTGRREAYYTDYLGTPQEFISAAKYGFLYQGQWYSWQKKTRGTPSTGLTSEQFVAFLQNHDQIANSGQGQRIHQLASPGRLRALTAVTLLGPATPMLFQGQEFGASAPFLYFADHRPDLSRLVREGRRDFLSQFTSVAHAAADEPLPDPSDPATFERCKLDWRERDAHQTMVALHASLLQLRASDGAFRAQGRCGFDGAVISQHAFAFRYFGQSQCGLDTDDRLLVVNLGVQLELTVLPEPLLAPPHGFEWSILWSSEDPLYGGGGTPDVLLPTGAWRLPAESALVLYPVPHRAR